MKIAFIAIGIFVIVFSALGKFYEYREMKNLKDQIKADSEKNKRPESRFTFTDEEHQ